MTGKSGIFQNLWRINFSTHTFWNICDGKNFSFTDISKSMREKLILHRFWKIPLFPVILSWIIYDNELKTVKYISPTKSIRRENVRHVFLLFGILHISIFHLAVIYNNSILIIYISRFRQSSAHLKLFDKYPIKWDGL